LNRWKKKISPKFPKKNALILGPTDKEEKVRRGKKRKKKKANHYRADTMDCAAQ
jgi:hypothetical protein